MAGLHAEGFQGFVTVADLRLQGRDTIPASPGIYLILRDGPSPPDFLEIGTGGHFKDKDPNVSIARLQHEWVTDARIVYIGQSGSGSSGTLKNRIRQMLRCGRGARVDHWGGRLVWQLRDAEQLQVCWREAGVAYLGSIGGVQTMGLGFVGIGGGLGVRRLCRATAVSNAGFGDGVCHRIADDDSGGDGLDRVRVRACRRGSSGDRFWGFS